jgi:hypothetical protein
VLAELEKISVKVSPSSAPVMVPVKVGFALPYARVALLAVTVRVAGVTVIWAVAVCPA